MIIQIYKMIKNKVLDITNIFKNIKNRLKIFQVLK